MSLGEIVVLLLVGIIVVGPRNLPPLMRTAGQWVARIRRMSLELRTQSGIDELLRREGLDQHIHELRSLSRLNVVDTLMATAPPEVSYPAPAAAPAPQTPASRRVQPLRDREYPVVGCDAYGAAPDAVEREAP